MFESSSLLAFANALETAPAAAPGIQPGVQDVLDLAGYEALVDLIRREGLDKMPGDLLEIGCFLGGGTAKLAKVAAETGKRVWVIDVFDPAFDVTQNLSGNRMADLYAKFLRGRGQEEVFREVTAPWSESIRVIKEDSMKVQLPDDLRLAFAFTDGNHNAAWVKSDFKLVWKHLVPGGWAGFHDYGGDLPEVTAALNSMMTEHDGEIRRVERIKKRWILLVQKRAGAETPRNPRKEESK